MFLGSQQQKAAANRNQVAVSEDLQLAFRSVDLGTIRTIQIGQHQPFVIPLDLKVATTDTLVVELNVVAFLSSDGQGRLDPLEDLSTVGAV